MEKSPEPESSPEGTTGPNQHECIAFANAVTTNRLPAEYQTSRPDHVLQLHGVKLGRGWGACFRGGVGIGKTYAACALAYRLLSEFPGARNHAMDRYLQFTRTDYLFTRIGDCFTPGATETRKKIIDDMVRAYILILDDLGAEKTSEFTASTLCTIIAMRRDEHRYSIVTTNQTLDEIDAWEPRIASRLGEMAEIRLPNRDWRMER